MTESATTSSKYTPADMTPAERSERARLAAHTRWAGVPKADRAAATAPARAAADARLDQAADPESARKAAQSRARLGAHRKRRFARRTITPETRQARSEALAARNRERWAAMTPEQRRESIMRANAGSNHPEHRAKLSAAMREQWALFRAAQAAGLTPGDGGDRG